jgi:hypothetical protein
LLPDLTSTVKSGQDVFEFSIPQVVRMMTVSDLEKPYSSHESRRTCVLVVETVDFAKFVAETGIGKPI